MLKTRYYNTETGFGRRCELFAGLEKYLGFEQYLEGLVVGAGMCEEPIMEWADAFDMLPPGLHKKASWEYLDLYFVLRKHSNRPKITVVDIDSEVCECVKNQKTILVSDFYASKREYASKFLEGFGHQPVSKKRIEQINSRLAGKLANRVTNLAVVDTTGVDLEVVNRDFLDFAPQKLFDVVSICTVIKYMENRKLVPRKLRGLTKIGGLVVAVDDTFALTPLEFEPFFRTIYRNRESGMDEYDEYHDITEMILQRVE